MDVGCGDRPKGDVNCDKYIGYSPDFFGDPSHSLITKKIPNFIRCDAHYLPFKDSCFQTIVSSHMLEHSTNPYLILKEFYRVTSMYVRIEVPNLKWICDEKGKTTLYTWGEYSLRNLIEQFFVDVKTYGAYHRVKRKLLRKLPLGWVLARLLEFMGGKRNIIVIGTKPKIEVKSKPKKILPIASH